MITQAIFVKSFRHEEFACLFVPAIARLLFSSPLLQKVVIPAGITPLKAITDSIKDMYWTLSRKSTVILPLLPSHGTFLLRHADTPLRSPLDTQKIAKNRKL
jgi:hypothetical protein